MNKKENDWKYFFFPINHFGCYIFCFFSPWCKFGFLSTAHWGEREEIAKAGWRVGRRDGGRGGGVGRQKKKWKKQKKDVHNLENGAKHMRNSTHTQICTQKLVVFFFCFFFLFFCRSQGLWKLLSQGSNPRRSSNLSCCSENTESLTHWATRELSSNLI